MLSTEWRCGAVCAEILRVRERERASATPAQKLQNSHGPRMRQNLRKKRLYARNLDSPLLSPQSPPHQRICKAAEFLTALQILHHHRQLANFTHTHTQAALTAFSPPAKRQLTHPEDWRQLVLHNNVARRREL